MEDQDPNGIIVFTITGVVGDYTNGDSWEFTTYPYNSNIELDDNTIPIMDIQEADLTVTTTLS